MSASATLPLEPTPFVGRASEIAALEAALAVGRLVTLTGPAGIGKTRVALQVARRATSSVRFVDASRAHDVGSLCDAVSAALGVERQDDPVEALGRALAALGHVLVIVDAAERAAPDAANVIGTWLSKNERARFLVACRARLRLREERVVELAGLGFGQGGHGADPLESDAVALLVERLRAHRPAFRPTAADCEDLVAIVQALEGVPLAIELAAARADLLGLPTLRTRLESGAEWSAGGWALAPLRDAIETSWQLLDERQRRALAIAAVFGGSFSIEAAEAVLGTDALELIADLRDRSLLASPEPGRHVLGRIIRAFSAERLAESSEQQDALERHQRHYLALGEAAARRFDRCGGGLAELGGEMDNLLLVLERELAAGVPDHAARAVLALGPALTARGPARKHLELLDRVVAVQEDDPRLLSARGAVRRSLGDTDGAEADLLAALELCHDDPVQYAAARKELGVVYHDRRDVDRARACYEAALPLVRAAGQRRAEGAIVGNLAALDHDLGRFEQSAERYREALDVFREIGDTRFEAIFVTNLAVLEQEQGRRDVARRHYQRALALLADVGDRRFEAIALGNLGVLEHETGQLERARELHEKALRLLREVGDPRSESLCRARLGAVLASAGDVAAAEEQLDEAERLVVGKDPLALALVRIHACFVDIARGDEAQAFARLESARSGGGGLSLVELNDDARMVLRMLALPMSVGDGPRLRVGSDSSWFEPPGGARQDLSRYAAARRLLEHLVVARLERPGAAIGTEEMFATGWPGVRITASSASNRLFVQLAKLRKMGLKLLLLRTDEGYLLDPATPLERASD